MDKYIKNFNTYSRDLEGYGQNPPNPKWPQNSRLALQFVLNYEEGAENCVLYGDAHSESFLSEIISARAYKGVRHKSMESLYEYGSRVGVWRILKLFKEFNIPITIFAVAVALTRNLRLVDYLVKEDYDVCSHGYRWIDYQFIDEQVEKEHINNSVLLLTKLLGKRPLGWYTGRDSPNTRKLIIEQGGFLYDSDAYDDDLPHWATEQKNGVKHLIIPYTLDANDMRFTTAQGFNCGDQFYQYLKDTFDVLYQEGSKQPKMMSVGMHGRILGRPGRILAMRRFLQYVTKFNDVWFCTRLQIAQHWLKNFI